MKATFIIFLCIGSTFSVKEIPLKQNMSPKQQYEQPVNFASVCDECQEVIKRFDEAAKDRTKMTFMKEMLSGLCHETEYEEECEVLVGKLDIFIAKLSPYLKNSLAVCTKFHMCSNLRIHRFHRLFAKRYLNKIDGSDLICEKCQFATHELLEVVDDHNTQAQLHDFISEKVCAHLGQYRGTCDIVIKDFLPNLFQEFHNMLSNRKQFCVDLKRCTPQQVNLPRLTANEMKSGSCKKNGSACNEDSECCTKLQCWYGNCTGCFTLESFCYYDPDCCSGICSNNSCSNCLSTETFCNYDSDCCSNICSNNSCSNCLSNGASCNDDTDCCNNACSNGSCSSGSCKENGFACIVDSECCTKLQCWYGNCTDCFTLGSYCLYDPDCCSGICSNNSCSNCLSTGTFCNYNPECCSNICSNNSCSGCLSYGEDCNVYSDCCSNNCFKGSCSLPKKSNALAIGLGVGLSVLVVVIVFIIFVVCYFKKREKRYEQMFDLLKEMRISSKEIVAFKERSDEMFIKLPNIHIKYDQILGQGVCGTVYKGHLSGPSPLHVQTRLIKTQRFSDCDVAVKVAKNFGRGEAEQLYKEIQAMKTLGYHENIMCLLGWTMPVDTPALVFEIAKTDLLNFAKGLRDMLFPYKDIIAIFWQITRGMQYIASKQMVHRDLAARNILLCENDVAKISDFGLCCRLGENFTYRSSLTKKLPIKWLSIEALTEHIFSEKSDIWSFGILVYEVFIYGHIPYITMNHNEVVEFLNQGNRLAQPEGMPEEVYEMVRSCWEENPEERPNFGDLEETLRKILDAQTESYGYLTA